MPLACGPQISGDSAEPGQAGAPETYEGNGGGSDDGGSAVGSNGGVGGESDPRRPVMGAGDAGQRRPGLTGKSGFRPRHRRGHSAGDEGQAGSGIEEGKEREIEMYVETRRRTVKMQTRGMYRGR